MRFERTSAPRHPSGCSGCVSIRWGCRSEKSSRCSSDSTLTVLTERFGTGRTRSRRIGLTRRRRSRRGSPSMKSRSPSPARQSGSTLRSTRIPNCAWRSTCSADAGSVPRRRSSTDSPRNTTFQMPSFSPTQAGISRRQLASISMADSTTPNGISSRSASRP